MRNVLLGLDQPRAGAGSYTLQYRGPKGSGRRPTLPHLAVCGLQRRMCPGTQEGLRGILQVTKKALCANTVLLCVPPYLLLAPSGKHVRCFWTQTRPGFGTGSYSLSIKGPRDRSVCPHLPLCKTRDSLSVSNQYCYCMLLYCAIRVPPHTYLLALPGHRRCAQAGRPLAFCQQREKALCAFQQCWYCNICVPPYMPHVTAALHVLFNEK